jgi:hypothetical protein
MRSGDILLGDAGPRGSLHRLHRLMDAALAEFHRAGRPADCTSPAEPRQLQARSRLPVESFRRRHQAVPPTRIAFPPAAWFDTLPAFEAAPREKE